MRLDPHRTDALGSGWSGRRVLITGASGFIGRHLVRRLADVGAQVWVGLRRHGRVRRRADLLCEAKLVAMDVSDANSVARAVVLVEPDVVFHLAATGVTNPTVSAADALAINTGGVIHLLESLRGVNVQRVVLVGSSHEYGAREATEGLDPINFYAASKAAAWAFARAYWRAFSLPLVIARPFQVYGPGQTVRALIPSTIRASLAGEDFPMTSGEQERDYVFVRDVVEGLIAVAEAKGIEGESLDLGTGKTRPIREVVKCIWEMTGGTGQVRLGAFPCRPAEVMVSAADAERTARLTGWRASTSLQDGLRRTVRAINPSGRAVQQPVCAAFSPGV